MKKQKKLQPKKNQKITEVQKAQAVIAEAQRKKIDMCNKEIIVILNKYGVELKAVSHVILSLKKK